MQLTNLLLWDLNPLSKDYFSNRQTPVQFLLYLTKKARLNLPDIVKSTAVLFMIQLHLMELFTNDQNYHAKL